MQAKVAARRRGAASREQLSNGVPLFPEQLSRTLEAEEGGDKIAESVRISGASGSDTQALSEMGVPFVDPLLGVVGNRQLDAGGHPDEPAANAFKFTPR